MQDPERLQAFSLPEVQGDRESCLSWKMAVGKQLMLSLLIIFNIDLLPSKFAQNSEVLFFCFLHVNKLFILINKDITCHRYT